MDAVSATTMSIAIPEDLKAYVIDRVAGGEYTSASEYLRDLIRRDRRETEAEYVRKAVAEGLASGDPVPFTIEDRERMREELFGPRS